MLIAKSYEVINGSRVLQEALGLPGQPGCKQRVQAPDVWEVVFQVMVIACELRVACSSGDVPV